MHNTFIDTAGTFVTRYSTIAVAMCIAAQASGQCENTWASQVPTQAPLVRAYHSMVFDTARDRVMLFGGTTRTALRSDLWEWDGTTWALLNSIGPGGGRRGMAMSFHESSNTIHMFGGVTSAGIVAGTWQWGGSAWNELPVVGPSPRADSAMVYDAAHNQSVLFGGWGGGLTYFEDTWIWDGAAWNQAATPPANTPHSRGFHAMTYDSTRGKVVLFGGLFNTSSSSQYFADTWEWDGTTWIQIAPASSPPARAYHAMAFNSTTSQAIMFGGFNISSGNFNDSWAWNGSAWAELPTPQSPSTRTNTVMVYDPTHDRTVLFGGQSNNTYFADTWTLVTQLCCLADFNNDSVVDFFDYLDFVDAFSNNLPSADFNNDTVIDFFDYLDFVDAFSVGC